MIYNWQVTSPNSERQLTAGVVNIEDYVMYHLPPPAVRAQAGRKVVRGVSITTPRTT
jgi:hypothetical protein